MSDRPALIPFSGTSIPQALKARNRWAPWAATWDNKRGKYDKRPGLGLSINKPESWLSFNAALVAFQREPHRFAGLGYVMTNPHGIVGIDLDRCVDDGVVAPWAQRVVDQLQSYTEISPSGHGLRIFVSGSAADGTNHEVGIEVYGGEGGRFLTLTGRVLPGAPSELRELAPGALAQLREDFGIGRRAVASAPDPMPDLLDDLLLPDVAALPLSTTTRNFLLHGEHGRDRSGDLHAAGIALYQAGLPDDEVLSILASNDHAMEVALDHRAQDHEKALAYLWREHCVKAKPKAAMRAASVDDFEDVSESEGNAAAAPADRAQPAINSVAKPARFEFVHFSEAKSSEVVWAIENVLPFSEVALIYGAGSSGKSFFALDLAMSIARGAAWRGLEATKGVVAYVAAEGGSRFPDRTQAYAQHHGIDATSTDLHLLLAPPNILDTQDVQDLIAALRALQGLSVVFLDTLAKVTPGADENSAQDMGKALANCEAIHRATGAMVVLVSHTGKDMAKGPRGWSGIPFGVNSSICIEREGEYRCATIVKAKDTGGEGDRYPFRLETMTVREDSRGKPITSCVALPIEGPAARRGPPAHANQRTVLQALEALRSLSDSVTTEELVTAATAQLHGDKPGARLANCRQAARAAVDALEKAGYLTRAGAFVKVNQ